MTGDLGADGAIIGLDLPAAHKYMNILGACIGEILARVDRLADREATVYNVQLAVHEVCTNIIDHAYAGQPGGRIALHFRLAADEHELVVDIDDTGRTFDVEGVPQPDLDNAQVHGYGLFLVHSLMDGVDYVTQPGTNHWHLRKTLVKGDT
jgi:serine/threonine-protein kinase RsbW